MESVGTGLIGVVVNVDEALIPELRTRNGVCWFGVPEVDLD